MCVCVCVLGARAGQNIVCVISLHSFWNILCPISINVLFKYEDAPLVKFMCLVFTRIPGESYRMRFRSLLLYLCQVFGALITEGYFSTRVVVVAVVVVAEPDCLPMLVRVPQA